MAGHSNRVRADQILDAAGALLLRMGYRKVTIDDVARATGIGKGTVYLHWRNKERLFEALLQRESVELLEELLARLQEDPAEILPHRFIRASFLATVRRPLIMALLSGSPELFGVLRDNTLHSQELLAMQRCVTIMISHGLLRADIPDLIYALRSASAGFYLTNTLTDEYDAIPVKARADALAHTIHAAFEPPEEPDPAVVATAAAELGSVLEELNSFNRDAIYSHERATLLA